MAVTKLDYEQVIKAVYDEDTNTLRGEIVEPLSVVFPVTKLDYQQVIKAVYDEDTQTLRMSADGGGGGGVTSLNDQTGAINITAGSNITIDDSTPGTIEISSTGGAPSGTSDRIALFDNSGILTDNDALKYFSTTGTLINNLDVSSIISGNSTDLILNGSGIDIQGEATFSTVTGSSIIIQGSGKGGTNNNSIFTGSNYTISGGVRFSIIAGTDYGGGVTGVTSSLLIGGRNNPIVQSLNSSIVTANAANINGLNDSLLVGTDHIITNVSSSIISGIHNTISNFTNVLISGQNNTSTNDNQTILGINITPSNDNVILSVGAGPSTFEVYGASAPESNAVRIRRQFQRGEFANVMVEDYVDSVDIESNQTDTIINELAFESGEFEFCEITYKVSFNNLVRVGTLKIATDGTNVNLDDINIVNAAGAVDVTFDASMDGSQVLITYTTGAGVTGTLRSDIKKIRA